MAFSVRRSAFSVGGGGPWGSRGAGLSFALSVGLHAAWAGVVLGLAGLDSRPALVIASGEEGVPMVVTLAPLEAAPVEVSLDAPQNTEEPRLEDLLELPDHPSESVPLEFPVISTSVPVEPPPVETRPCSRVRERVPRVRMPPLREGASGESTPEALGLERPDYPALAVRRGYEGTVLLRIEILADGAVGRVEVARPSGFPVLDRAALEKARTWRLTPATVAGMAVRSEVEIRVRFELK